MRDVVIVDSVRTGLTKAFRGSFNLTRSDDLLAHCIDSLLDRNPQLGADEVEDVYVGAASHTGEQDGNLARLAVILSKLPVTAAGVTINRFCSSGLQSIALAANQIATGQTEVAIAGGVDSISMRTRQEPGKAKQNQRLLDEKPEIFMAMGNTAEVVARRYQVTREAQDEYALQSQQRYQAAVESGAIAEEIVGMNATMLKVNKETGEETHEQVWVDKDECNRPQTTLEGLASLPPAFEEDGSVTAGNASQLSDGASMTLLMSADRAAQLGLTPIGIYRGFTVAGCEPDEMGIGPVFAIPRLLKNAGLSIDDIDLWELNEAFSVVGIANNQALGLDPERVNVNGGAVALGHPLGSSGSRIVVTLVHALHQRGMRRGAAGICNGGGGASALVLETVDVS